MKVKIKAFLTVRQAMGGEGLIELDMEQGTLGQALQALIRTYGQDFGRLIFDPETHDIWKHNQILVNGRHYTFLPAGLDTTLKDGDVVSLIPAVAGG